MYSLRVIVHYIGQQSLSHGSMKGPIVSRGQFWSNSKKNKKKKRTLFTHRNG